MLPAPLLSLLVRASNLQISVVSADRYHYSAEDSEDDCKDDIAGAVIGIVGTVDCADAGHKGVQM